MATIVTIQKGRGYSNQIISALDMIRSGMGVLQSLDQMRGEAIGAGTAQMQATFGAVSEGDAQALSDRWGFVVAKWNDLADTDYSAIRDLVNAMSVQS